MKSLKSLLVLCVLALPFAAQAVEVKRVVSPGGVEAWLVEDHTNPIVTLRFAFAGGSELDPEDKSGLANLAAGTMDEGAGPYDSQAFQRRLADKAIELRFEAGLDQFAGRLRTLKDAEDEAFELLRLALTQPRFDAEPVERIKSQIQAGLRRDSEDPDTVAYDALFKALFPGHGYARRSEGTEDTVKALTAADLKDFARTRLARGNLRIGVVGDIDPARLGAALDKVFGALPQHPAAAAPTPAAARPAGRLTVIDKDIPQSAIVFGHAGPKREDGDYYAALVMNHILGGGGFTSRLYAEVREKRGLAYSVGSSLYPLEQAGLIVGSAGTDNARVTETLAIVKEQWRKVAAGEVSEQELTDAKTYLTGSFALGFTSTDKVARVLVAMQVNDLGIDYLDKRNGFIEKVSLEDVQRAAAKHLDPERLDIVVVGRPQGVTPKP